MKPIGQRILKKKLYLLLIIPILYAAYYLNTYSPAMPQATSSLSGSSMVSVVQDKWISFIPKDSSAETGIIFYPGGKVAPESYAPLMKQLAEKGYSVFLVKMPFNLAIFNSGAAKNILNENPDIKHWIIGGHSLGGTMSANYVNKNPGKFEGIFFLASYPVKQYDLSDDALKSLSIYAENDGLISLNEIDAHKKFLPLNQTIEVIEGGNHGQFGYYGLQDKDGMATITREGQQEKVLTILLKWLQ